MIKTATEIDFILRRLDAWAERGVRAGHGRSRREPIRELHLELTHRCNQRCLMCHHWALPAKSPASIRREMGAGDVRRFVSSSKLLDEVEVVVLTGGEPWLKKDVGETAAFCARRWPRARIGVLSNLWNTRLARSGIKSLKKRGVKNLWLGSSLDGLEKSHDEMRGRRGAFRGLMDTVGMIRREFPDIEVSFNFTITPRNRRDLWPAYLFAKGLGVWFGAQLVVNHKGFEAPETFLWTKGELARVRESIDKIFLDICRTEGAMKRLLDGKQIEAPALWSRLLYWRDLSRYSLKPRRLFEQCPAGRRFAMLDPEGDLFFCPVNKHRKIGNVRREGLDAVWSSAKAESERRFVDSRRCDCCLNCIMNPILDQLMLDGVS